jgi:hypothetical protein
MSVATTIYDYGRYSVASGSVNVATGTLGVMLLSSSYTPNFSASAGGDHHVSDISSKETSGGGYARQFLTGVVLNTGTFGKCIVTSNPTIFSSSAGYTYQYLVIYVTGSTDAASTLLVNVQLNSGSTITVPASSTDTISPDPVNGWFYL